MKKTEDLAAGLIRYLKIHGFQNISTQLGRRGMNITASCPFAENYHEGGTDRNPSWGMLVRTGQYRCFTCNKEGNLKTLASELGIPLFDLENINVLTMEESLKILRKKLEPKERPKNNQIMNLPDNFSFFTFLSNNKALNWLRFSKGFGNSTIQFFGIGYNRDTQNPIFPFTDDNNFIIGWQERNLRHDKNDEFSGKKYYNSPGLEKTGRLYNYFHAKKARECVVVEAFLSVMRLHQLNIAAVAVGGSSLSKIQAGKLGIFEEVTFCFDPDMAGEMALQEAAERMRGALTRLYVAKMTDNAKIHRMSRNAIVSALGARRRICS